MGDEISFVLAGEMEVPPSRMTPVPLEGEGSRHVKWADDAVTFRTVGWYEVLMEVAWDPDSRVGTRFSHTMVPDQEPLHSEAIAADVLVELNGGKQRLRGNAIFGLDATRRLVLEVWQDSGEPVRLRSAEIRVRELCVPWPPA